MNLVVANTDYDWYRFLSSQESINEVNFWKPSGRGAFKALRQYEPFVFKLKKAHCNRIWQDCMERAATLGPTFVSENALYTEQILTPSDPDLRPDKERLEWHGDAVFLKR
jgi:hypothetical protein